MYSIALKQASPYVIILQMIPALHLLMGFSRYFWNNIAFKVKEVFLLIYEAI